MATSTSDSGDSRPHYRAFLVRIWRDSDGAPWRASITHVVSGELYKFAELPMVWQHIQHQLGTETDRKGSDGS